MNLNLNGNDTNVQINQLIVAGWTGRNKEHVQHHIDELAAIGIVPPSKVPLFYQVANSMILFQDRMQVLASHSSGEVEPVILKHNDQYFLGLGSDHTDRKLEAYSVAYSKQICPKPVAREFWALSDVLTHLDQIELTSWLDEGNGWTLYQEGSFASILPITELLDKAQLKNGDMMLCGTLGAIGGVRRTPKFKAEMHDPQSAKKITLMYETVELAEIS